SKIAGSRDAEGVALYENARIERERGNLAEARARVEEAFAIFDSLRAEVLRPALQISYGGFLHRRYEFYIDLLMRLHQKEPSAGFDALALRANEKARARALLEQLSESRANIREGIDPELVERERKLQRLLDAKAETRIRLLSGEHTEEQAAALAVEI